jgi:hypothetical protein
MNKRRRTCNDITQKRKERGRGTYLKLRANSGAVDYFYESAVYSFVLVYMHFSFYHFIHKNVILILLDL